VKSLHVTDQHACRCAIDSKQALLRRCTPLVGLVAAFYSGGLG